MAIWPRREPGSSVVHLVPSDGRPPQSSLPRLAVLSSRWLASASVPDWAVCQVGSVDRVVEASGWPGYPPFLCITTGERFLSQPVLQRNGVQEGGVPGTLLCPVPEPGPKDWETTL